MTICIAAFAAKSKAIVCIADRALTYEGYAASAQSDSGVSKIIDLPGNWCALFSCASLTLPTRILGYISNALSGQLTVTLREMETTAKEAFDNCWLNELESEILKPILLSRKDLWERNPDIQALDGDFVSGLAEKMAAHKNFCSIIFCGFEGDTPHMFVVSTPCQVADYDWQGFAMVGEGAETARNQLLWENYSKEDSLASALYDVFKSKVATEVLLTPGYKWNWRLILPGKKPEPLPKDIEKMIDRLWIESDQSPFSEKSRIPPARIEEWKKKIRTFAASALTSIKKSKPQKSQNLKRKRE